MTGVGNGKYPSKTQIDSTWNHSPFSLPRPTTRPISGGSVPRLRSQSETSRCDNPARLLKYFPNYNQTMQKHSQGVSVPEIALPVRGNVFCKIDGDAARGCALHMKSTASAPQPLTDLRRQFNLCDLKTGPVTARHLPSDSLAHRPRIISNHDSTR